MSSIRKPIRPGSNSGRKNQHNRPNKKPNASSSGGGKSGYIQTKSGERKFVGGAAIARQQARSGSGIRILRPDEKERVTQPVSMNMSPMERFFAGLLRSSATDYLPGQAAETWRTICQRLRLPVPEGRLKAAYPDAKEHFGVRAALVMEEARYAIAEGMAKLQRRSQNSAPNSNGNNHRHGAHHHKQNQQQQQKQRRLPPDTFLVKLVSVEQREKSGHSVLMFVHDRPFTPDQIMALRQGTVFACRNQQLSSNLANAILTCVLPASRDEMIQEKRFAVLMFHTNQVALDTKWELAPVASLLTEQRKFEACTSKVTASIPFLHALLGGKGSTHTRFTEDDNGATVAMTEEEDDSDAEDDDESDEEGLVPLKVVQETFDIARLNKTQETAARSFLRSDPNTITLIQGPPGTGKTTLLVSIICRYVSESVHHNQSRSLMVCAPTNKAVSVLCTRFLQSIRTPGDDKDPFPCNVVLLGDDDKLLDDDYSRNTNRGGEGETSRLRSIFLYTWIPTVLDDYGRIKQYLLETREKRQQTDGRKDGTTANWALNLSRRLEGRLRRSKKLSKELSGQMSDLTEWLEQDVSRSNVESPKVAVTNVQSILHTIREWRNDLVWQELLGSAHIIFCTLASAGATILKKSIAEINDLIVDEAAASTEPDMYIPFQFRPERLLAVGDPKQLPATVASQVAEQRGMSRSLHERLMYDCNYPHLMLDVQYRMKPALSRFPSQRFYSGDLSNGSNVKKSNYGDQAAKLLDGQPYSFLQVNGNERQSISGSFENQAEAQAVAKLVEDLQRASRRIPGKWHSADRIRIITFYQAQVSLIKRLLFQRRCRDVIVATVDSSQGCEANIVIVSFVRSQNSSGKVSVGFLSDDRRLNVAITRAKYQLICVGNAERMLSLISPRADTVRSLTADALDRRCLVPDPSERDFARMTQAAKRTMEQVGEARGAKKQRVETTESSLTEDRAVVARKDGKENKLPSKSAESSAIESLDKPDGPIVYSQEELSTFLDDDDSSSDIVKHESSTPIMYTQEELRTFLQNDNSSSDSSSESNSSSSSSTSSSSSSSSSDDSSDGDEYEQSPHSKQESTIPVHRTTFGSQPGKDKVQEVITVDDSDDEVMIVPSPKQEPREEMIAPDEPAIVKPKQETIEEDDPESDESGSDMVSIKGEFPVQKNEEVTMEVEEVTVEVEGEGEAGAEAGLSGSEDFGLESEVVFSESNKEDTVDDTQLTTLNSTTDEGLMQHDVSDDDVNLANSDESTCAGDEEDGSSDEEELIILPPKQAKDSEDDSSRYVNVDI